MRIVSVSVGLPRTVEWRGEVVETSIFKSPVHGPVQVEQMNLAGDRQSDLTVHGGREKAVYAYPAEHYPRWREDLPNVHFDEAAFGENFTTTGTTETNMHIGDRLRAGTAEFIVTQPRTPCYKLSLRFDRLDMGKRMIVSGRTGFYLSVAREGVVTEG
ncbi:MAG: MOSC domain-containing protein, partial [Acidobacteriota bacterium]